MALCAHLLDLSLHVANALADPPPLDLNLLLTEPTTGTHTTAPPTDLSVIGIGADETRQQVMQARGFDLQPAFVCARVLGEYLEDDLRAVEHPRFHGQLEVSLLTWTQIFVADDQIECTFQLHLSQRVDFSHSDEVGRIDRAAPLHI
jgi:hypothetical protein